MISSNEHLDPYSGLLARNELNLLLDEQMSERERQELQECEAVCRRFLEWDLNEFVERKDFGLARSQLEAIVDGTV